MTLTEQHIIDKFHPYWKQCDHLCFLSKNLYNSALYKVKQNFLETSKFIRYNDLAKDFCHSNQPDFKALHAATSQQILMVFDQNIKSFFALIKKWKRNKNSLSGCPKFPKYKDKIRGRNVVVIPIQRIKYVDGFLYLPKKIGIKIRTDKQNIKQVRIVPKRSNYVIEIIYKVQEKEYVNNNNYLSIDLGVNNLATCFDSKDQTSIILNGRPMKSINQFYNKERAKVQSNLEKNYKRKSSNRLNELTLKHNNKVKDYLHKSSRTIVDYCKEQNISNIVIGMNKEWKQGVNLGKKTNQNFVGIPYSNFIDMIKYKGKLEGINVITHEESYTSKCSALDLETMEHKDVYLGTRVKRGLYQSKDKIKVNADMNGAMNIMRKEAGDKVLNIQTLTSRGQVVWPVKVNFNK